MVAVLLCHLLLLISFQQNHAQYALHLKTNGMEMPTNSISPALTKPKLSLFKSGCGSNQQDH